MGEARPRAQLKSAIEVAQISQSRACHWAEGEPSWHGRHAAITPGLPRLQMLPNRSKWLAARRAISIRECTSNHPAAPTPSSLLLRCQTSCPMCALAGNAGKAGRISAGNKAAATVSRSGRGRQHCQDLQPLSRNPRRAAIIRLGARALTRDNQPCAMASLGRGPRHRRA